MISSDFCYQRKEASILSLDSFPGTNLINTPKTFLRTQRVNSRKLSFSFIKTTRTIKTNAMTTNIVYRKYKSKKYEFVMK